MNTNPFIKNENKPLTNKIKETTNKSVQFAKNSFNTAKELGQKTSNTFKSEMQKASNAIKSTTNSSETYQSVKRGTNRFTMFAQDFAEKNSTISKICFYFIYYYIVWTSHSRELYIISLFTLQIRTRLL